MKKWIQLDSARTRDGKEVSLHEHDGSYTIRVDQAELMSTRKHASEEKLAELCCEALADRPGARVLIGGLGFGFTLRSALGTLGGDARIVVVEMMGAVIAWNRNPAYRLAGDAMTDSRVTVVEGDIAEVIRGTRAGFDSIILDVDNGPDALSSEGNSRLYNTEGLAASRAALRAGGRLAFWSARPDAAFAKRFTKAGFHVAVHACRPHSTGGGRHTIYVGQLR